MKTKTKLWAALLALAALTGSADRAAASSPSYLNIDVTFNTSLSVAVDGAGSSTYTVAWTGVPNQELLSPSSATVMNDTGGITERWKLFTNQNSLAASGSAWSMAASSSAVGADQFAVQAVFGSSNTASGGCSAATTAGTWNVAANAPLLTTTFATGLQYTTAGQLASTELVNNGQSTPDVATNSGSMLGTDKRALCWRVIAPTSTVATATQNIQVIVAAF
ncbi:MAG TPA: hypothetical protein VN915_08535 [Elusimicrobiota bacterium]|nr:hypothetical protein [Elusimicrobiota bacterium]